MPKKSSSSQSTGLTQVQKRREFKAPSYHWDLYDHGLSYTFLSKFYNCREDFRLFAVEGLRTPGNEALQFGTIFHKALEFQAQGLPLSGILQKLTLWQRESGADPELCRLALVILPHYHRAWSDNQDAYFAAEDVFRVPYKCPFTGKIININGRFDEIIIRDGKLWVQENKTKSQINEAKIADTLHLDLQTMIYAWAAQYHYKRPVSGVLYNIIRKPGLKQGVKESEFEYLQRVSKDIEERPEHYFKRIENNLGPNDIENFVRHYLAGKIYEVIQWWESIKHDPFDPWVGRDGLPNPHHSIRPFGIYDQRTLSKGDYYNVQVFKSKEGLIKSEHPFPELVGEQGDSIKKLPLPVPKRLTVKKP